jgi:UDP-N-acetylglucosamine--N-acetylmuramyl-(pentapeptide) pyrophosphoryl-undecaprenol N-acetylglucosamine transferase
VFIAGGGTGGHLMPALALATELRRQRPDLEPVLVGAERGIEARLLPDKEWRYWLLPVEPLYRRQWWRNARWPLVAWRLRRALDRLFQLERPVAVLGTGGYASLPAVWMAARRRVPAAIQEQNAYPGLATRWLARVVRHVYLGAPEARARLRPGPGTRVFDTGNPIALPDRGEGRRQSALRRFGPASGQPVVLVTGGSQGAAAINQAVAGWLDAGGGTGLTVLWATGHSGFAQYARYHQPPGIQVFDFLDPIGDGYAVAELVVARAGMMTGAELCAWGLPSILIPLPTAAADHQRHNAEAMAMAGAAVVLLQRDLTPSTLGAAIARILADRGLRARMAQAAEARGRPAAAADIVAHLQSLI